SFPTRRSSDLKPKWLFTESIAKEVKNINAYLLDSDNIYITPKTKSISNLPEMNFGNMANDGGNLFLNSEQKKQLINENPKATSFVRKLVGSLEFLRGIDKYCLWIEDEHLDSASNIPFIKERIERTKESRLNSKREATNKL